MEIIYKPIDFYDFTTKENFIREVKANRRPLVVRGLDVGPCLEKWSPEYLAEHIKNVVTVHVSVNPKMSFLKKNFTYMKMPFDEFLNRASGKHKGLYKPLLCENEVLYYRSVSFDRRSKECSNLKKLFPSIADDFCEPDVFNQDDFFSSVFRIASPDVQVWTHYDTMDNILVQVTGTKRVTLFSPDDIDYLYLVGDKSEVSDIYNPDTYRFPMFLNAVQHECVLNPGEALFIPALWFHSTTSNSFSISFNVFWKNLSHDLYDKQDTYGNKDLIPATKAFASLKKTQEHLNTLPYAYKKFYIHRCIIHLKKYLDDPEYGISPERPRSGGSFYDSRTTINSKEGDGVSAPADRKEPQTEGKDEPTTSQDPGTIDSKLESNTNS